MNVINRKIAIELGLKRYFTGKPCKYGHVSERILPSSNCAVCAKINASKKVSEMTDEQVEKKRKSARKSSAKRREKTRVYQKEYREKNKEKEAERLKKWYEENKEKIKEKRAKYREKNKYSARQRYKEYYQKNKQSIFNRRSEYQNKYRKEKYSYDVSWRMSFKIRAMLARVLQQTKEPKHAKSELMIGYTRNQLLEHLESQFKEGMTWDNYGKWHIDHIKPISAFIKEGEKNPAVINSLENLRPLWAEDNFKKGSKY